MTTTYFKLLGSLILAAAFSIACNKAAPPVAVTPSPTPRIAATDDHGHEDGTDAPRISLADAKKDFDSKSAVFVDTHAPDQFEIQHIPGAINIPANNIGTKADKLNKADKIIAYCS
jgi:hypothetical protein